ncbi:LysR family transcriptional regulator [Bosea sp. 62]|nr:LysR family transcriptional regulator [Bosea sp. 46]CAD5266728.1 LysR family transcriptional regulator [Bosea sp. 21B]CAD5272608.1 LysR family transcriptional regulator [Bosea sp. 7B]VVT56022.1 DNA-binding transcriptional regulator, LysR family [Bosea sp. EC-HK365B]VXB82017.1 LysR family transcriptional regulator [Bosea sp. 29B]VXC20341.1 LysR family transcriptional regulator [Bosea sp. 125]VXC20986.1 LysR family transcriptional regulator [Bosea sp. 62]VXC70877.1 LysR family transcription
MMDRLTSMQVFVKVVEAGTLTAAGISLGLSSQMVGKHLRFLEERTGARLLHRTTRRQSLTEIGSAYYERCKLVLAEADAADAIAQNLRATPRGKLRINAPLSFGAHSLTPALIRYMQRYPEVSVDLSLTDRVVDLAEEGYDAVIRISPLKDSGLIARALRPYQLIACASPAYLAARGTPQVPADLADHECLGFAYWAAPPLFDWEFIGPSGIERVTVRSQFLTNNGQALRQAALSGFGITLQAEDLLREDIANGRLVRILPGYEGPTRPMHIVFMPDRSPTPKLRSFVDFIVAEFG